MVVGAVSLSARRGASVHDGVARVPLRARGTRGHEPRANSAGADPGRRRALLSDPGRSRDGDASLLPLARAVPRDRSRVSARPDLDQAPHRRRGARDPGDRLHRRGHGNSVRAHRRKAVKPDHVRASAEGQGLTLSRRSFEGRIRVTPPDALRPCGVVAHGQRDRGTPTSRTSARGESNEPASSSTSAGSRRTGRT